VIIEEHIQSFISMLIIKLKPQALILDKLWMHKYEINYYETTNIIKFVSKFCTHSKRIETKTTRTKTSNKEKKHFFPEEIFFESIKWLQILRLDQEFDTTH
jgi:hypothetical protein